MATIRLYRAIKEKQDAQALHDAATLNNWGPPKRLPHNSELILKLRAANVELQLAMEEAQSIVEAPDDRARTVAIRIAGERDVAKHLLKSLIEQGFTLGGNDGEEHVGWFDQWEPLYAIMFDTDEFFLEMTRTQDDETIDGWIHLVYGNSPYELISNNTVNITKFTIPTQEYIKKFYDTTYIIDRGE